MSQDQNHEPDPVADFAEAVGNGQIHPAVVGMFAHLDNRLSDLLDRKNADPEDPDDSEPEPEPEPEIDDKAPSKTPRKATPSTVAGKANHR